MSCLHRVCTNMNTVTLPHMMQAILSHSLLNTHTHAHTEALKDSTSTFDHEKL